MGLVWAAEAGQALFCQQAVIEHGVTGFLVDSIEEAVAAIARLSEIDRAACRAAVAARFTVDQMADRYLKLYRSILG